MTREELFRAIGEVREDRITEAETVKRSVRHWRRAGVLAACLALTVTAVSAAPWMREQLEWKALVYGFNPGGQPEPGGADSGEVLDGNEYRTDGDVRPASDFSENVEIGELHGPGDNPGMLSAASCAAWLTPEEIFARDTEIFRGTVRELHYFRVEMVGMPFYYTRAIVEVTDAIRGSLREGETCSVLWLGAKGYMTTSVSGPLEELKTGSEAIFMPARTGEDTGRREGDSYFCYGDLAELYLSEGMRFVFAVTEDGLAFERGVYAEIADAETLEAVADYIRGMLEHTRPAAVSAEPRTARPIDPAGAEPGYFPAGAGEEMSGQEEWRRN